MAGIFNGPPRGGTRGGQDQFSWDNVKSDKDREYYLGHSVKALAGRWQKNKDPYWYTKEKESAEDANVRRENEMAMVKQREQDLMMEALGLKPKAPKHTMMQQPRLDQEDMQKLLGKGAGDDDDCETPAEGGERVKGLGFNASRTTGAIQMGAAEERLDGMGLGRATGGAAAAPSSVFPAADAPSTTYNNHRGLSRDEIDDLKRKQRRKEEKKVAKRAKKEAKREKKEAKRRRHHSTHQRSPSRSRSRSRSPARRHRRDRSRSRSRSSESEESDGSGEGRYRRRDDERRGQFSGKEKREDEKYVRHGREEYQQELNGRSERRERSRERDERRRR